MRVSFLISVAVHAAVLIFGVLPNVSSPERLEAEFSVAEVSILSQDEWISMSAPAAVQFSEPVASASVQLPDQIPDELASVSALTLPADELELPPPAPEAPQIPRPSLSVPEVPQLPRPVPADRPEVQLANPVEPPPPPPAITPNETAALLVPPPQPTNIPDAPPAPPVPEPVEEFRDAPDGATAEEDPALTAAPKVAPEAAPEPETDVKVGDEVQVATRSEPADNAEASEAVDETTAPEHAATQIVTEAEETDSENQFAPVRRPSRVVPRLEDPDESEADEESETLIAQPPARPADAQEPENESEPEDIETLIASLEDPASENDLISQLIEESISDGAEQPESDEPLLALPALGGSGLPSGLREGLRTAIADCWNVGALSTAAMRTVVTIGFSLERDGRPITETIKLVASEGESGVAIERAFEAGQRAILCGLGSGYDLPLDSYERWRDIEMTFDPEQMRLK